MQLIYNDGGRAEAGFKGTAGDCATRAVAIMTGKSYREVYDEINKLGKGERKSKRRRGGKSTARAGVYKATFKRYVKKLGLKWTPTMFIGSGCRVHLKESELPSGKLLLALSHHWAVVENGKLYDTHDCSREGTRCVYGYFYF